MNEREKADPVVANPWGGLARFTTARIALGRAGTSLPTKPHLDFQLAHARARTAVHRELDVDAVTATIASLGREALVLRSQAADRAVYLQRPDAGRRLDEASRTRLLARKDAEYDLALVVGDGLSALAIERNAPRLLEGLLPRLEAENWRIAPLVVATQARVALGDEIGETLGARIVVVLIGERPGLSSPDSLGLYMTMAPRSGLTDEARNCISNIREGGMSPRRAVEKLLFLMRNALRLGYSGVALKDDEEETQSVGEHGSANFLVQI